MKAKIISCLMVIVVIVCAYFYAKIDKNSYIYHRNADTSIFYSTGILEENETIAQTFVAKEDSIDGINIKVFTSGNVKDVKLHCVLQDENEKEVSKTSIHVSELKNNKFNNIDFPKVTDTKNKQYTLLLEVTQSDEQNGIGFYVEPGTQKGQKLSIDDKDVDGMLITRILCHRFDLETFVVLLGMLTFITIFMKVLYKMFK